MAAAEIIIDGIRYSSTRAAAESTGLSQNYVSKLCKMGIPGTKIVKGTWYVQVEALQRYIEEQSAVRARYLQKIASERRSERAIASAAEGTGRGASRFTKLPPVSLHAHASHVRRVHARYAAATQALGVLILIAASGVAFGFAAPPGSTARDYIAQSFNALASPLSGSSAQLASSGNVFDGIAGFIRNIFDRDQQAPHVAQQSPSPQPVPRSSTATATPPTIVNTYVTNPVVERVVQRVVTKEVPAAFGVLPSDLQALETRLNATIASIVSPAPFPAQVAASGNGAFIPPPASQRIDLLNGVTITNATITGTSFEASGITGTIGNVINSALATIADLTATELVATNASITTLSVSGTTTTDGLSLGLDCSGLGNGGTLTTDASGNVVCADDDGGGGTSFGKAFEVTTNAFGESAVAPTTTRNLAVTGAGTSTFAGGLEVWRQISAPYFQATSSTASHFTYASTTALSASALCISTDCRTSWPAGGGADFGKTFEIVSGAYLAPTTTLGILVNASSTFSGGLTASNATTTNATTTNLAITSQASTSNLTVSNTFTLRGITGFLKATAGVVAEALVDLASNVTGILPVGNGGTGLSSAPSYGQILVGNGTGYTLTATSSLGLPVFGYLFPSNATSTTLTFSGGLLSLASTTIGSGTQAGGLTVSGGATTTGFLTVQGSATSTFVGGIETAALNVTSSAASSTFANGINLSAGCFAVNGTCIGGGGSGLSAYDAWTHPAAGQSATTSFMLFQGGASSTLLSANQAWFGGTATTTITPSGSIGVGTSTPWAKLSVHAGAGENSFAIGSSTATYFLVNSEGNVAIGGTSLDPAAKLSLAGTLQLTADTGLPSGGYTIRRATNFEFRGGTGGYDFINNNNTASLLTILNAGNVGIGTTTPWRLFSMTGAVSTAQQNVAYDNTNYTDILTSSVGDYFLYPSGKDAYVNDGNLLVCASGSGGTSGCPSGTPSGQGNLIVETKVGIASSTPWGALSLGADSAIVTTEKSLSDGATIAISWLDGNQQKVTLGGNRAITFSNYLPGQGLRLVLCQDGTGSRTITSWPSPVLWNDGAAPTLTTTANKCDIVSFVTTGATGTVKILGSAVLNF